MGTRFEADDVLSPNIASITSFFNHKYISPFYLVIHIQILNLLRSGSLHSSSAIQMITSRKVNIRYTMPETVIVKVLLGHWRNPIVSRPVGVVLVIRRHADNSVTILEHP